MIYLLADENVFVREQELVRIFDERTPEIFDSEVLHSSELVEKLHVAGCGTHICPACQMVQ